MKKEVKTLADGPIYRRVPSIRESIHNYLKAQLLEQGVSEDSIVFSTMDIKDSNGWCCAQVEVKAIGTVIKKSPIKDE